MTAAVREGCAEILIFCRLETIRGHIFPATSANVALEAVLDDGSIIRGESKISKSRRSISRVRLQPGRCKPLPETLEAIRTADLITLGPGSLYTSVIPNILVNGIAEAIQSSPALKVYFVNLMWQPGETINFTASHHLQAIYKHAKSSIIDCVVLNSGVIPASLQRRYAQARVKPVENDFEVLEQMGVKVVTADLVGDTPTVPQKVRHSPEALANVVLDLATRARAHRLRKELLRTKRTRLQ